MVFLDADRTHLGAVAMLHNSLQDLVQHLDVDAIPLYDVTRLGDLVAQAVHPHSKHLLSSLQSQQDSFDWVTCIGVASSFSAYQ